MSMHASAKCQVEVCSNDAARAAATGGVVFGGGVG